MALTFGPDVHDSKVWIVRDGRGEPLGSITERGASDFLATHVTDAPSLSGVGGWYSSFDEARRAFLREAPGCPTCDRTMTVVKKASPANSDLALFKCVLHGGFAVTADGDVVGPRPIA